MAFKEKYPICCEMLLLNVVIKQVSCFSVFESHISYKVDYDVNLKIHHIKEYIKMSSKERKKLKFYEVVTVSTLLYRSDNALRTKKLLKFKHWKWNFWEVTGGVPD